MALSKEKIGAYSKRLLLSRMRLLCDHGFYGLLLMHMKFAVDEKLKTAATDGTRIIFGTDFLDTLSDRELDFVMMHQILHIVLQHCFRAEGKDPELFGIACDIVVNSSILSENHMDPASITLKNYGESIHLTPDGREGYELTAEQVYEILISQNKNSRDLQNDSDENDTDENVRNERGNDPPNGNHSSTPESNQQKRPQEDDAEADAAQKHEKGNSNENAGQIIADGIGDARTSTDAEDGAPGSDAGNSINLSKRSGEKGKSKISEKCSQCGGEKSENKNGENSSEGDGGSGAKGGWQELSKRIDRETDNLQGHWDDHSRWNTDTQKDSRAGTTNDAAGSEHSATGDNAEIIKDLWTKRLLDACEAIAVRDPANTRGLLPAFAQRMLDEWKRPQTDWRTILNEFIQEEIVDYSFTPPDRRFADSPFFLPDFSEKDDMVEDILFMIDTSGSMSDDMITAAYSEIKGAIDQFDGKLKGWLGFFDAVVIEPRPFENEEEFLIIRPEGGGGTSFDVIFDYVGQHMEDKLPASIIILTDGYALFPQESYARGIPVLWLLNNEEVDPPWGKVARITV